MRLFGAGKSVEGRSESMPVPERHEVLGHTLTPPFPDGYEHTVLAMGCFWGAEKLFWGAEGVYTTAAGYAGGSTPNPSYEEVCTGRTGHAESVLVVWDPGATGYQDLLKIFWENHDPTQGMRQGNDVGSQYRSALFCSDEAQLDVARLSKDTYQPRLTSAGLGEITTDIRIDAAFYYAEAYHQQYLYKNPAGYCPLHATGVTCA